MLEFGCWMLDQMIHAFQLLTSNFQLPDLLAMPLSLRHD